MDSSDWQRLQWDDDAIRQVIECIANGERPTVEERAEFEDEAKLLLRPRRWCPTPKDYENR